MLDVIQPLIINLRRNINTEENWGLFRAQVEGNTNALCEELNTRWLISVCDSYADMGTEIERRNAMMIITLVNMEKVGQSYLNWRLNYEAPFTMPDTHVPRKIKLWDGMTSMHLVIGDVTNNLFRRMETLLATTLHLHAIYHTVLKRIATDNTILGSMNKYHKHVFEPNINWRSASEYDIWRKQGKL